MLGSIKLRGYRNSCEVRTKVGEAILKVFKASNKQLS